MKAMIVPGNGVDAINNLWYKDVRFYLEVKGLEVIAKNMPDPQNARCKYWLSFIKKNIGSDDDSILIGHSSGAIAILRYLEKNKANAAILVSCYHTNLGIDLENKSGYFRKPWNWKAINGNVKRIYIYASTDDPFIDIKEPRFISDKLGATYLEFDGAGHFQFDYFPQIYDSIEDILS